jgi:hypothetical protein
MFESSVDRLLQLLGVRRAGENGVKPLAQDGMTGLFDQMLADQTKPQPRWAQESNFYERHGPSMIDGNNEQMGRRQ